MRIADFRGESLTVVGGRCMDLGRGGMGGGISSLLSSGFIFLGTSTFRLMYS